MLTPPRIVEKFMYMYACGFNSMTNFSIRVTASYASILKIMQNS